MDFIEENNGVLKMPLGGRSQSVMPTANRNSWGITILSDMEYFFDWSVYDRVKEWLETEHENYVFTHFTGPIMDSEETVLFLAQFPKWIFLGLSTEGVFSGGPTGRVYLEKILAMVYSIRENFLT